MSAVPLVVNVDGGARGNPGPAAIAAVVRDADGEVVEERSESIGPATNNVAEYRALLLGIERARALGADEIELVGDSELVVKQVRGEYRVKDAALKELHDRVRKSSSGLTTGPSAMCAGRTTRMPTGSSTRRSTRLPDRKAASAPAGPTPEALSRRLEFRPCAAVAQLARASACHAEGRGFESHQPLPRDTARTMSRENVEIVRRGNEAYARGDVAAMLGDIDAEMITYREEPDGATFHGPDGLLKAIAEWVEDFDEFTFSADEFIDANDDQVVVRIHQTATGSRSGAFIEGDFWFVHTLRGAKVVRLDMFASRAKAFECAGLN